MIRGRLTSLIHRRCRHQIDGLADAARRQTENADDLALANDDLVEELARLDLADATHPGGIHGAVETAADLIHRHTENTHTGHPATITPIRSAA